MDILSVDRPVTGSRNKTDAVIQRIIRMIATRQVGSRLPSERDLAAELGVARMTARKAMESLVADGLLERRPGSGSYVAEVPYAKVPGLSSFSVAMRRRGLAPSSRLLRFDRIPSAAGLATRLVVPEGQLLVRFTRLRLADDEPIAVETTWMSDKTVPGLTEAELDGSLFETLVDKFNVVPGQATSTIDAFGADAETAGALGVEAGAPCLRVQMDYLDTRRRPLMAANCLYRGDRYQLHVVLAQNAVKSEGGPN